MGETIFTTHLILVLERSGQNFALLLHILQSIPRLVVRSALHILISAHKYSPLSASACGTLVAE